MTYREYRAQLGIELSKSKTGKPTTWMIEQGYEESHKDMGWTSYLQKYGPSDETKALAAYMEKHQCGQDCALAGIEQEKTISQQELLPN